MSEYTVYVFRLLRQHVGMKFKLLHQHVRMFYKFLHQYFCKQCSGSADPDL